MNKILEFLQSQLENVIDSTIPIDADKLSSSFEKMNNDFVSDEIGKKNIFQLKSTPQIKKGQIWMCKQQYYDVLGNEIKGHSPYIAVLVSNVEQIANEKFIRIQPISPFTEFKANDDILVNDKTIIGFDFIIEKWNEQPILTSLLDEFIGQIDINTFNTPETKLSLSKEQKEFRKTEIRNTAYLRESINSLIEYEEGMDKKVVFMNYDNSIIEPVVEKDDEKIISMVAEPEYTYLQAAKKGMSRDRHVYMFEESIDGIEISIKIIKEDGRFILSVKKSENIELKDIEGKVYEQTSKNLYDELQKGIYFIEVNGIKKKIRIILK